MSKQTVTRTSTRPRHCRRQVTYVTRATGDVSVHRLQEGGSTYRGDGHKVGKYQKGQDK